MGIFYLKEALEILQLVEEGGDRQDDLGPGL